MKESESLRARAARCRELARESHESVGAYLIDLAEELEAEADMLDRIVIRQTPISE
jgi:hypothetical protein